MLGELFLRSSWGFPPLPGIQRLQPTHCGTRHGAQKGPPSAKGLGLTRGFFRRSSHRREGFVSPPVKYQSAREREWMFSWPFGVRPQDWQHGCAAYTNSRHYWSLWLWLIYATHLTIQSDSGWLALQCKCKDKNIKINRN